MEAPSIFTYHCICSHLVLATTRNIFKLPRRQSPGLDGAIIVPLPPPPRSVDSDNESEEEEGEEEGEEEDGDDDDDIDEDREERMEIDQRGDPSQPQQPTSTGGDRVTAGAETAEQDEPEPKDYTLLLSSIRDRRPCVIRREDGFEKRLLWRCGRCRLIFGYQIYDEALEELSKGEGDSEKKYKRTSGKKYYVYILPGGLTTALDMGSLTESNIQLLKED